MSEVTRIIQLIDSGDLNASHELLPVIYEELRRLAKWRLTSESPGQAIQTTALVHEAWLRLAGNEKNDWDSRRHFFGAAAEAMRRILIDQARRKQRIKHGGNHQRINVPDSCLASPCEASNLLDLDEALQRLEDRHPEKAQLIKLRFFAGMELNEIAKLMNISRATASRHWTFGRSWLFKELHD